MVFLFSVKVQLWGSDRGGVVGRGGGLFKYTWLFVYCYLPTHLQCLQCVCTCVWYILTW